MVMLNFLPSGLRTASKLLVVELNLYRRHRMGVRKAHLYSGRTDLRLNIGCGSNPKPDWINIDLHSEIADLTLDMREALPFRNGSAEFIYSEHFFEHLDNPGPAIKFLQECFRVLKAGGKFSLGVPDTQWPLQAYVGPDELGYFKWAKEMWHPSWCQTRLDHLNYHFRQDGEHRYAYDAETLANNLRGVGFGEVQQRDYDLTLDTKSRAVGTLYMDAIKQ